MQSAKQYFWCALGFFISGLNPLYWAALKAIPSEELLYHRSVWTALTLILVLALFPAEIKNLLKNWRRDLLVLCLSTIFIGINWFSYIWAVNHGFILDASIAYFIAPIITMLLSSLVLQEKQSRKQWAAITFCIVGVLSHICYSGHIPSLALLIALSFSLYGLLTKFMKTPPLQRLLFEATVGSALVSVFMHKHCSLTDFWGHSSGSGWLLVGSGLITALPAFLFIQSAKKLPYSVVGIMNYIVPSTIFFLGIFHFGELVSVSKVFMVACVWLGIVLYFRCLLQTARPSPSS